MKGKPMKYLYQTHLRWTGEKKGRLSSKGKPDIEVACPPEFGGHPDIWSPEDLFLSSVEVCTMTTFIIKIKIGVYSEEDRVHVEKIIKKVTRTCLISRSIKTDVKIEADISIV
jgi:organic hydroperoxide reductase OsmC/OhrA